jgi:hypothetical protein
MLKFWRCLTVSCIISMYEVYVLLGSHTVAHARVIAVQLDDKEKVHDKGGGWRNLNRYFSKAGVNACLAA